MAEILRANGIDGRDLRIITELYWHQTAQVRVDGATTGNIAIRKGVRQGCFLSPLWFNLYSEAVFREAVEGTNIGITINGTTISILRNVDDIVVIASSLPDIQNMMDLIVERSERYGLFINVDKTNLVVYSKRPAQVILYINNKPVEQVQTFRYLGAVVSDQSDPTREVRARI